jgi:hypothetical protein
VVVLSGGKATLTNHLQILSLLAANLQQVEAAYIHHIITDGYPGVAGFGKNGGAV